MQVNTTNVFYTNNDTIISEKQKTVKKSVRLTDYGDVLEAVNKGVLTVDGVTLELTEEVRNAIKEANEQRLKDCEEMNAMNCAIQNANASKQQGDVIKETMITQAKALEIARRISRGGKVPPQDEKLLMDYSDKLYQMAKQASIMAKEHEKYDSLVEEDSEKKRVYDTEDGTIDTKYQVQVEVSLGETPMVESVSEVAISGE